MGKTTKVFSNGISGFYDYGVLEESVDKRSRQRSTSGNSNVAAKTGNIYISGTMTDSSEIPTADLGF